MASKTLTIVHVLAPAQFGGLERVVDALATGLAEKGHEVHIVAILGDGEALPDFSDPPASSNPTIHVVRVGSRAYGAERKAVRALLREFEADVIHTHGYRPDVVDSAVGRKEGVATISTAHGFSRAGGKNGIFEWLQRRSYRRFDAVVAVSRPLAEELVTSGVPGSRVYCIRNAATNRKDPLSRSKAREKLGISDEYQTIGWVGRFTSEKGPDVMVRAFRETDSDSLRLWLLGAGPLETELRTLAQSLGVASRTLFLGSRPNAGSLMKAFDVLVSTSWTEGTPMVLLEAMAAGVPVVTTNVGGIPDFLSETEAILVPPGDPAAIAGGIEATLSDLSEARLKAANALSRLRSEMDPGRWLQSYLDIYQAIAS